MADASRPGPTSGPGNPAVAASARPGPAGPGRADQGADRFRPPGRGGLRPPVGRAVPQGVFGVSYLLPAGAGPDGRSPQQVVRRMLEHYAREADQCQLHRVGTRPRPWSAPTAGPRRSTSVSQIAEQPAPSWATRSRPKSRVLREPPSRTAQLPRLQDLSSDAAGHGVPDQQRGRTTWISSGASSPGSAANFTPQGKGPLKVLISYPADAPSDVVKGI